MYLNCNPLVEHCSVTVLFGHFCLSLSEDHKKKIIFIYYIIIYKCSWISFSPI